MIDFDVLDKKPILPGTSAPPPSYAAPPVPTPQKPQPPESKEGHHNYFEIDFDDDFDYQKVTPGQMKPPDRTPGSGSSSSSHKSEFADPKVLFRSKREKSPSEAFASPPRRNSFIEKLRSRSSSSQSSQASLPPPQPSSPPPSPPESTHLAPLSFPPPGKGPKTPSPSHSASTSDSEPILEDLQSVRKRLLQQARDSVIAETCPDNSKPLIDFSDSNKKETQSVNSRPSNTAPKQQQQQQQLPMQEDYWDHLEMKKALAEPPVPTMRNISPSNVDRSQVTSTYSLASEWRQDDNVLPPVDISDINSTYAVASELTDSQKDNRQDWKSRMQVLSFVILMVFL